MARLHGAGRRGLWDAHTVLLDEPVDGESLGELPLAGRPCVVIRLVPPGRAGEIRIVCR